MNTITKMLAPIKRQIYMIIGRALVSYVENSGATQLLQIKLLADEVRSDIERLEEYGLTTYPLTGSEAVAGFINGNRGHGVVLCVHDRRYRLTDLAEGEVCLYTHEDQNAAGHRIHLKAGNEIDINCENIQLNIAGDQTGTIEGNQEDTISGNKQITITGTNIEQTTGAKQISAATVAMLAATIALNGASTIGGAAGAGKAMATEDIISIFNNHTHNETGSVTAGPNSSLSSSQMTTNSKAV